MCELMAMSFVKPISADFSIQEFAVRGEDNADGWGLAWYPDQSLAIAKEPIQWGKSQYTSFLQQYPHLLSRIYIAHVRHRTTGGAATYADTHPFARELGGREFCFAHNGTLVGPALQLPLGRYRPVGSTDSEYVFCHLLEEVARREDCLTTEASWQWLHGKLQTINRMGKINCLLSDGQRLFCYHDANGWKGLHFRKVDIRDGQVRHLEDTTVQINLEGESFNHGYVVATRPLSKTGWQSFQTEELLVFENGLLLFSSHRASENGLAASPVKPTQTSTAEAAAGKR